MTVTVGEYTVVNDNGIMTAYRYGREWPAKTQALIGDGLVLALVQEVDRLRTHMQQEGLAAIASEGQWIELTGKWNKLFTDLKKMLTDTIDACDQSISSGEWPSAFDPYSKRKEFKEVLCWLEEHQ